MHLSLVRAATIRIVVTEMQINWKRGLFRLWLVASIIWIFGSLFWLLNASSQEAKLLVSLRCNPLEMTNTEWHECYERQKGPAEGGTWFSAGFRSGNWLLLVVPPILALAVGAILIKVTMWIRRGFVQK